MITLNYKILIAALLVGAYLPLAGRDIILEFKGAYFRSTDCRFKQIYNKGGALYGPEVTFRLCECKPWYGFASIDYLAKRGHSIGLCSPTKARMLPLALGVKYIKPVRCADLYAGLGFQAVNLRTSNCTPDIAIKTSKWGYGGIAKLGAYFDLCRDFVLDLFVDYSFVKVGKPILCQPISGSIFPLSAKLNGAVFGAGFGYRFN
jgi:hypothetical protein